MSKQEKTIEVHVLKCIKCGHVAITVAGQSSVPLCKCGRTLATAARFHVTRKTAEGIGHDFILGATPDHRLQFVARFVKPYFSEVVREREAARRKAKGARKP